VLLNEKLAQAFKSDKNWVIIYDMDPGDTNHTQIISINDD